jgi:hypothetical protein
MVEEALGFGSPAVTVYVLIAIVLAWAAAIPLVLRRSREASLAVLGPLGLQQDGARLTGERHGRRVTVAFSASGSVTRIATDAEPIVVRRQGHEGASWLLDLREAEALAEAREP